MKTIGTRIREFRKKRNMSLSRLADGICSPYTLLRIEKGEVSPSLDLTTKICGKLSIPIEYLLHHEEDPLTKKINYAMNLCREMVYDNELDGLQMTIQHLEDLTKGIQVESSVPAFIEWHKAILVHQKDGNPEKAEKMLRNLLPPSLTLVNELEIGIANSLGLVLISTRRFQEAEKILTNALKTLQQLPYVVDQTLYPRIVYNLIYIAYILGDYHRVMDHGYHVLYYLDQHHLHYMAGEFHHLLSLAHMKIEQYRGALQQMERAVSLFHIESRHDLYIRSLRALAEIRIRVGDVKSGLEALQKAEEALLQQGHGCKDEHLLREKIEETKRRIKQSNQINPHNNSANISVETYTSTKDHQ